MQTDCRGDLEAEGLRPHLINEGVDPVSPLFLNSAVAHLCGLVVRCM